jgi:hypothetical protein
MGKPYSDDLRERVVAAIEAGHTRTKVAELYNIALSTVGGFIKRNREFRATPSFAIGGALFEGRPRWRRVALRSDLTSPRPEAVSFAFIERSVLFGGIRARLFAFSSLEAVAEPVAGTLPRSPAFGTPLADKAIHSQSEPDRRLLSTAATDLIPTFPGSNPGAPASHNGLSPAVSGAQRSVDIPEG